MVTVNLYLRGLQVLQLDLLVRRRTARVRFGLFGDADLGLNEVSEDAHLDERPNRHVHVLQELDQVFRLGPDELEGDGVNDGLDFVIADVLVDQDVDLFAVGIVVVVLK